MLFELELIGSFLYLFLPIIFVYLSCSPLLLLCVGKGNTVDAIKDLELLMSLEV